MKNPVSFITANYVARELNYRMTEGWSQGHNATSEAFSPLPTFSAKFDELLSDIRNLGFANVDLWVAHLDPSWATEDHLRIAAELLQRHGLKVISLAGGFGDSPEELAGYCRVARGVGAEYLAGAVPAWQKDRAGCVSVLREHGIKWAFENHPQEKTADDVLSVIGTGDEDLIGVACDTGWFGTNDCSAAAALRELQSRLMLIHLKDVREAGQHRTCQLGEGVVGIEDCLATIDEIGYVGPIGIEHEPETYDPSDEIRRSLALVEEWANASAEVKRDR